MRNVLLKHSKHCIVDRKNVGKLSDCHSMAILAEGDDDDDKNWTCNKFVSVILSTVHDKKGDTIWMKWFAR